MYTTVSPHQVATQGMLSQHFNGGLNGSQSFDSQVALADTRTGTKVDKWKSKVEAHLDASSPYHADYMTTQVVPSTVSVGYYLSNAPSYTYVDTFSGVLYPEGSVVHASLWDDELRARAVAKFISKLQSTKVLDGLTFLGELPETLKLLRNPLKAFRDATDKTLSTFMNHRTWASNFSDLKKRRRMYEDAVTGTYLEWVFGVKPMLSDIEDILRLLETLEKRDLPQSRQTARVFSSQHDVVTTPTGYFLKNGYMLFHTERRVTSYTELKVQYTAGLHIRQSLDTSKLAKLTHQASLGLPNVPLAIYNLTPFSWAVDYMSNIGSLIEYGMYNTSRIKWINETLTYRTTAYNELLAPKLDNMKSTMGASKVLTSYEARSGNFGQTITTRTTTDRSVLTSFPTMPLVFTHPGGNVSKWLNLAAVALQLRSHGDTRWLAKKGP